MLIEFQVENFGPIKDTQTLTMLATADTDLADYYIHEVGNLKLLKLAIIYGPNASGKTTILKALNFLKDLVLVPKIEKSKNLAFTPFLFDEKSKHSASLLRIVFLQEGIKYDYEIAFNQQCVLREKLSYYPKGRQSEFFTRTTDIKNEVSEINWGSTVKLTNKSKTIIEGNTLWNESVLAAFNKSNASSVELLQVRAWFSAYLQMMISPHTNLVNWATELHEASVSNKSMMVDFLKKADVQIDDMEIVTTETDFDAKEIELILDDDLLHSADGLIINDNNRLKFPVSKAISMQKYLYFQHKVKNTEGSVSTYTLPFHDESRGTMQYYGLTALLTALIKGKILSSIDEIDSSLHPDLMKHFILTFLANAKQSQLIVTAHNLFFLEDKDILRKDAIWFTQKRENGSTELYSLADFDSSIFRKNASFINAYKIGKLGAKPNLGTIFSASEQ